MLAPENPLFLSLTMARSLNEHGANTASSVRTVRLSPDPLVLSYSISPFLCKLPSPHFIFPVGNVLLLFLVLSVSYYDELRGGFSEYKFLLSWATIERVLAFVWQLRGHSWLSEVASQVGKLKLCSSGTATDVYKSWVSLAKLVWACCSFQEHQSLNLEYW